MTSAPLPPLALTLGRSSSGVTASILPRMANRHGLIAGATGTGKTVTLQMLAEQFSRMGVPVFMADVKGDLAGLAKPGLANERISNRLASLAITDWEGAPCPNILWDVFGKAGIPMRTTVSEVGPLLLGRFLDLNPTQQDVLEVLFKIADDQGMLLLDLKDLSAMLSWVSEHSSELRSTYGNLASSSVASIQRGVITLGSAGGDQLFGEPALRLEHLMQTDFSGNGVVSILDAAKLLQDSRAYSTLLLWLLSELFEQLDEVGDLEKPKLVFFFDEAHLLFRDAPIALVEKIELVVRLIRSKGVGVYFVTQNPLDIPEAILGQLGNRVQHALRAYTPADQKAVRTAAQTFRPNPNFSTEEVITVLEVGEALVSLLDEKGAPTPVERVLIAPPRSRIGPLSSEERAEAIKRSPLTSLYSEPIDRASAFEILKERRESTAVSKTSEPRGILGGLFGGNSDVQGAAPPKSSPPKRQGYVESFAKSMLRSVGSALGREILRGALGSIRR
jgi:DNA helicase HerA-like ATPase